MQNRYTGDASDFIKFLILRRLALHTSLKIGLNWCLVEPDAQELLKNDGKHIGYLQNADYQTLDKNLFETLENIIQHKERHIKHIENSAILGEQTTFFGELIPKGIKRFAWLRKSLEKLEDCDIIFYDPDNGLEITSCGKFQAKAKKLLFYDEVLQTFQRGKSIVIYQHANRSKRVTQQVQNRVADLCECLNIPNTNIKTLYTGLGSSKFYLIISQNVQLTMIHREIETLRSLPIFR